MDHVVEVGSASTPDQSMTAMIGVLAGFKSPVTTALLMQKALLVQGVTVGGRRHQLDFIAAVEACNIRPVLDRRFALEDLAAALRYPESGAHFGKIVIEI